jgi:hypothetical protein
MGQGSDKTEARQQSPNLSNSDQHSGFHWTMLQSMTPGVSPDYGREDRAGI